MTAPIPGPVHPTATALSALRPLPLPAVTFAPDGMLGGWQGRNADRTLPHCVRQLDAFGARTNLRRVIGEADGDHENMWFADSDVHKTLEAVAWELGRTPDDMQARAFLDATAGLLAKAQGED